MLHCHTQGGSMINQNTVGAAKSVIPLGPLPGPLVISVQPAANVRKAGRPANSDTGRQKVLNAIFQALEQELRIPRRWIARYDPAKWELAMSRLSSEAIGRIMARLRATLPHPSVGLLANLAPEDAGYAAGFVEGEGCVSIIETDPRPGRKNTDFRAAFQVSQSNPHVLDRVQRILGAHSYLRRGKKNINLNKVPYVLQIMTPVHIVHALAGIYHLLDADG